jgi:5-hydroxyisourate hydrolase-like protein (transthyretin family)
MRQSSPLRVILACLSVLFLLNLATPAAAQVVISGTIKDATGTAAIVGVNVQVFNSSGFFVQANPQSPSNAQGTYSVTVPAGGPYFIKTNVGSLAFIDRLWTGTGGTGTNCVGCQVTTGTPVTGSITANFQLDAGGQISGTLKNRATSVTLGSGINVNAFTSTNTQQSVANFQTNSSGVFTSPGLPAGSYYLKTSNVAGYVDQVFNAGASGTSNDCLGCSLSTAGTTVSPATPPTTANFSLTPGGTISGTVNDPNGPKGGIQVTFYNASGQNVGGQQTSSGGNNQPAVGTFSSSGLPQGTYYVATTNNNSGINVINQVYSNNPYIGNNPTTAQIIGGTPVVIPQALTNQTGKNFTLSAGATISGNVKGDGANLQNVSVQVMDGSNLQVGSRSTDTSGNFSITGLAAGTYYVRTSNSAGFIDQAYHTGSNVTCVNCNTPTVGSPLPVTASSPTSINFALVSGGKITGTVVKDGTATGISGISVTAFDPSSNPPQSLGSATTASDGTYTITGLQTGNVTVKTSNSAGYLDKLYNNIPCTSCSVSAGVPVSVATGQTAPGINFALVLGGRISGTITNASTSATVSGVTVSIYNSTGAFVTNPVSSSSGIYTTTGLPGGSYFVATTFNSFGLVNQLYNGANPIACLNCTNNNGAVNGTALTVTADGSTTTAGFALVPGITISGTVKSALTGLAATNASVNLFNASNVQVASTGVNSGTFTTPGLLPGSYWVKTSNSSGLIDQVYKAGGNLVCSSSCRAPDVGTAVTVTTAATPSTIDFSLDTGGSISGMVTNKVGGAAISNLQVQAYDSAGNFVNSQSTNSSGVYTIGGLTAGNYYVATSGFGGFTFINQVFNSAGNVPCQRCTVTTSGSLVAVTVGATKSGIDFALTAGATITGTITNASGGAPIAGINMSLFSSSSPTTALPGTQTNGSGVFSYTGLSEGTYYLRTNNNLGYVDQLFDGKVACGGCSNTSGTAITVTAATPASANFSLTLGGRISGTVTDQTTGNPVSGINVSLYSSSGSFITTGTTNDAGKYVGQSGLAPGTYFAQVISSSSGKSAGYIGQLFNGIKCTFNCFVTTGTPIPVVAGVETPNINFVVSQGGRVTGTITDVNGGAGVEGVSVQIFDSVSFGPPLGTGTSSASGTFAVTGLPAGTFVAKTSNSVGYIDKLYDNFTCSNCSVTTGTPFVVATGATTPGVNFKLDKGGTISGTVMDTNNVPIANASVSVLNSQGSQVTTGFTTQTGAYITGGVPAGTYFVKTNLFNSAFINQLYNGQPCVSCSAASGTPVPVTLATPATGINFILSLGGGFSGKVTDSNGTGLSGVVVLVFNGTSNFSIASTSTTTGGTYTVGGLGADTYYAKTSNSQGLVDKLYDNVACVACGVISGKGIAVTLGTTTTGVNFSLAAGGGISGTVTDASTAPIGGITVGVYTGSGSFLQNVTTDPSGNYKTSAGLAPGVYFLKTQNDGNGFTTALGFIDKLYKDTTCVGFCNVTTGTPVVVAGAATTTGINFSLVGGGQVTGTITSGGVPLERVPVSVFTASGLFVTSGSTNANGVYKTGAVPAGSYFVKTFNSLGYVDQVYNGRDCSFCNPTTGNAVTVTTGQLTSGIDFSLAKGGRVTGTVKATADGSAIPSVSVSIYNSAGTFVTSGSTDASGNYATFGGLPTGTYYAATSNSAGYADKIYDDVQCLTCLVTTGKPIAVTAGSNTSGINFLLVLGGRIAGTITDAVTHLPIPNSFVNVYSSTGVFLTQAVAGNNGKYITGSGLGPGQYFARAASRLGYVGKVYNDIDCPACSVIIGTAVTVAAGQTTNSIDFALSLGGKVTGTVTDAASGAPLSNITVQTFNQNNNLVTTSTTDAGGQFVSASGLPAGTYFVRTQNNQGYVDQVYSNKTCLGACLPNSGVAVTVTGLQTTTGINFSLVQGGRISGNVKDAASGLPLANAHVSIFDTAGKSVTGAGTDNAGNYVTNGLPAGTYFARGGGGGGGNSQYTEQLFDSQACLACSPTRGTPISVTGAATTPNVNFALALGGTIIGNVTSKATGLPIGNVKVSLYTLSGSFLGGGLTNGDGSFGGSGVPAGQYLLRTFNLLGFVDQAYSGIACAPCLLPGAATPITITAGQTTAPINMALDTGGLVSGYLIDAATGAPLAGSTVSFFRNGTFVGRSGPSDDSGYYAISLPAGSYTAHADAVNGYTASGGSPDFRRSLVAAGAPGLAGTAADFSVTVTQGVETAGVAFGLTVCVAPTISPTSLATVTAGMSFSGAVSASGGTGPYTFSVSNGVLTPGLTLNTSSGALSGTPTVQGTANFTVGVADALSCSATQPYAQLTGGVTLAASSGSFPGGTSSGSFDVVANAADSPWAASAGASWITLVSGSGIGSGTASFTLQANPSSIASRTGTILVADQTFTITQAADTAAPALTTQPADQTANAGGTTSFTAAASGAPIPTVQWQVSTNGGSTFSDISGATSATLSFTTVAADNGKKYRAVFTNGIGTPATSNAATLTVNFAPAITKQPTGQTVASRGTTMFAIGASGNPAPTVQWQVSTGGGAFTPLTNTAPYGGVTTSTLTITTATAGLNGNQYRAVATNTIAPSATSNAATLTVLASPPAGPPIGFFDTPSNGAIGLTGSFAVTGWALAATSMDRVEIWRDLMPGEDPAHAYTTDPSHQAYGKVFIASAPFVAGSRPDVAAAYPNYAQATRSGWGYLLLSWGLWNQGNGTYTLYAHAYDTEGNHTLLGTRTITVDNAHATKPFGALDTPGYGNAVFGSVWNYGWALTPKVNGTPSCTVSTVQMTIDSAPPYFPVSYGAPRSDIAAGFPGFSNSGGAGGAYYLDTTALGDGMHQIGWLVTDSCGRQDGVGSRLFTVQNGSPDRHAGDAPPNTAAPVSADVSPVTRSVATVAVRRDGAAWQTLSPNAEGWNVVAVPQDGRIEIQLPPSAADSYEGVQQVAGERRPLPLGSSIDAQAGIFYWQPAAAFLGKYDLVFAASAGDKAAGGGTVSVRVVVGPAMRAVIDTPQAESTVAQPFTVAGWALDLAAAQGTGVDAVHVWAYPTTGAAPIFLGIAAYGGIRPDVGAMFGETFAGAGYDLTVDALLPGTYDIVVYPHRASTNTFDGAQVVRVTVRAPAKGPLPFIDFGALRWPQL